ncbi:MAG TPA: carboxypeptidase-like regulatory domain-containing protein [Granulicella sp.]|nr:carboxypeptidase-like regulatory domain-containing protein [Granulicella sp.]
MHFILRTLRSSLQFVLPALLLAAPLGARAQVVGGSISGTVTDASGGDIAGAVVVVHNAETGTERTLTTDAHGHYAAPSLAVGRYQVSATANGFAAQRRSGIALTVGQSTVVDLSLGVGEVTQEVNVEDAPAVVNLSTEQTSGLVSEQQVKQLPLNGRSYDQLILLNPGTVNYTGQRSGGLGTSNSSVGNMFAISGRRPQDNVFLLNGVEYTGASLINVTPGGTSGQLLGVDAVREFNVVTDTYSATYGKRDGAQISIVTASGTNKMHGDVYEFLRNSYLDSRNYFDPARIPEFQRNNFGAALGGPIKKDKVFLFANYEGYRQNLGISDVTLVPDNAARAGFLPNAKGVETATAVSPVSRQLLNLWPVQNGPEVLSNGQLTGIAEAFSSPEQHIREDFGTTRLDANLTANDLFFAVYTVDDSDANTPTQNPYSVVQEGLREQVLSAQEQHVFSARLLNTARVGFSRASFSFQGDVPAGIQTATPTFIAGKPTGAVVIAGSTASNGASSVTTAGANVGANNAVTRNLFTFDDHIFWTVGRHQIEAGVWLQRLQSNDNLVQDQYGQASFASLASFLAGNIKTFTYAPNPTELGWRSLFADSYLEDTFKLSPRVEVRAGIRTESSTGWSESQGRAGVYTLTNGVLNTTPSVQSNALTDNRALLLVEPRLGVAWDVFGDGKTSVRGGVGLHHSLLDALNYRLDQAAPFNTVYTYSGTSVAAPVSTTPQISPSSVQTDMATPAVLAYSLKIEHQLAPATSITVGYAGSHSTHQILSGDLNEPAFVTCPNPACPASLSLPVGTIYYPTTTKANPALSNSTSWWSGGSGNYNALVVDFRHDLANGLLFRANYTYAKNLDDGSAWNTSVSANTPAYVEVPSLPRLDYGPAATDIRHAASFNGTYELPFGAGKAFLAHTGRAAERVISGWSVSTIASLQTGFPFSPQLGYNPTGSGDSRNPVRPNRNPAFTGSLYTHGSTAARVAQYFNPNAFSAPAYGTVGDVGRDSLTGPGYADWDLSLLKDTKVTETTRLQFRAEFFNVLNHTNLQLPNEVVYAAGPTQGTVANQTTAPALGSPGVITSTANTARQIQLGLKFLF